MSNTPCDWCVNEEGMHFCPFSEDPTSDMCRQCEEERRDDSNFNGESADMCSY